jgi:hypothetical protein
LAQSLDLDPQIGSFVFSTIKDRNLLIDNSRYFITLNCFDHFGAQNGQNRTVQTILRFV